MKWAPGAVAGPPGSQLESLDPQPPWQNIASFTADVARSVGDDQADPPVDWAEDTEPAPAPNARCVLKSLSLKTRILIYNVLNPIVVSFTGENQARSCLRPLLIL